MFYYWNKNHVEILIEKELTKEEIEEKEDNNFMLELYIPYHAVYYARYVNCYAESSKAKKYICSCQKEALKNKLIMFDDYLCYNYCLNDRKKLFLEYLGLPDYYKKLIEESPKVNKYIEYFDLFNFKDNLCNICNNVKSLNYSFYLNNGESKFSKRYAKEKERLYSINGLVDPFKIYEGNYYLEELLSLENKKLLDISDKELLKELKSYELDCDLKKELAKFKKIDEETKKILKCDLKFAKNNNLFDYSKCLEENNLNVNFILSIQDIYDKRFKIIRKKSMIKSIDLINKLEIIRF